MRIAIGIYLAVFTLAGLWSVVPDDPRTPILERVAEALAFLVLAFGMLLFLLERPVPGGAASWLAVTALATIIELSVVLVDRKRTIRAELLTTANPARMQRFFRVNDLAVAAFFLPASFLNIRYALG